MLIDNGCAFVRRLLAFAISPERLAIAATLVGFALRLPLLNRYPLREDEAIYAFWALHALREDPWFLSVWPDKPPLFLWALAGALQLFGTDVAAARALNVGLSTLTIPAVAATAVALWGRRAGPPAALAMALSPFAISFAPTLFTDPLLTLAGMMALLLTLRRRPFWAGLWLGAAVMTKQQGLLYGPLILGVVLVYPPLPKASSLLRLLAGAALVVLPVVAWDAQRWATAPSPWDLGVQHYGELVLLPPDAWLNRLSAWLPLLWELTGGWVVWLGMGALLLFAILSRVWGGNRQWLPAPHVWIGLWATGFVALHVLVSVAVWDRYLLPMGPAIALLLGGLVAHACRGRTPRVQLAFALALLLLLLPPACQAGQGYRPIGGDHGDYAGLHEALAWLEAVRADDQLAAITLYHQRLGWHYQFYLYDQIADGVYDLRWFPSPVYLADNAAKAADLPRFYIQPDWAPQPNLDQHLAMRGIQRILRYQAGKMTVYELRSAGPSSAYRKASILRGR